MVFDPYRVEKLKSLRWVTREGIESLRDLVERQLDPRSVEEAGEASRAPTPLHGRRKDGLGRSRRRHHTMFVSLLYIGLVIVFLGLACAATLCKLWRCPFAGILGAMLLYQCCLAYARDLGQWENQDPAVKKWYEDLMQPDNPAVSCCGEAEAYWCDDLHTKIDYLGKKHNFCTITDDRPDAPRKRIHIDIGTEIEIPDKKMVEGDKGRGNPTGHNIVFLSRGWSVYCFVLSSGI
jgi:hypothetical protein